MCDATLKRRSYYASLEDMNIVALQTAALEAARAALQNTRARAPSRPDPSRVFTYTDTKCAIRVSCC